MPFHFISFVCLGLSFRLRFFFNSRASVAVSAQKLSCNMYLNRWIIPILLGITRNALSFECFFFVALIFAVYEFECVCVLAVVHLVFSSFESND